MVGEVFYVIPSLAAHQSPTVCTEEDRHHAIHTFPAASSTTSRARGTAVLEYRTSKGFTDGTSRNFLGANLSISPSTGGPLESPESHQKTR